MSALDQELKTRLDAIRAQGLYRELRRADSPQGPRITIAGREFINFSSNDYLGLANHPILKEAAIKAVERYGAGAGASRLICGSLAPYHELEESLAAFKGTEAALTFSSGYAAAIGTIGALLDKEDVIITDKLVHACLVDAARLCGAQRRIFAHNDLNELEEILKQIDHASRITSHASRRPHTLIATESVFSMDGDFAPLKAIVALKEKYGAWLMVDEAHATGIHGPSRRGLAEECGVSDRIEIQMGTLGKALGSAGGFIGGSRALIDYLINRARSFIYSTASVPAAAAAATAGIRLVRSPKGAELCEELWVRVALMRATWVGLEFNLSKDRSPILPLILGNENEAVTMALALREKGLFVPAIRYPSVPRGTARLRFTTTAAHSEEDHLAIVEAISSIRH